MKIEIFAVLVISIMFWYFYYGIECYINGGGIGRNQFFMPFQCLWEEFTWLLPGGTQKKIELCDNRADLYASLGGPITFFVKHILIPFGPAIYLYYRKNI